MPDASLQKDLDECQHLLRAKSQQCAQACLELRECQAELAKCRKSSSASEHDQLKLSETLKAELQQATADYSNQLAQVQDQLRAALDLKRKAEADLEQKLRDLDSSR